MARRLLVVGPSWLGDAVMMGALIHRLRDAEPDARITVLTPEHLQAVVARLPGVDDTLVNPFAHGALKLPERARFGRGLRGRFDTAFVLPHSWKSALVPFFAGIPERTGFVGEARYLVLNDARPLDKTALPRMVDRFCLLADPAGAKAPAASPRPSLGVDATTASATLVQLGLPPTPAVALCVGAEYGPAKRWPARHFAELAHRLTKQGMQAWLVGGPNDAALGAEIAALKPAATDLTGRTTLAQAVDLIGSAKAVVANDSGLMHVAAALDRPLIAIYGSSSPTFTPPLSDRATILSENLSCSPCFERVCPLGHMDCLNGLSPNRVWAAVQALLPAIADG